MKRKEIPIKFVSLGLVRDGERTKNRHHRKPRSRGGLSGKKNISRVISSTHVAFHYLFNSRNGKAMSAQQISQRLEHLIPAFEELFTHVTDDETRVMKSRKQIVDEFNNSWINPSFIFVDQTPCKGISTMKETCL